MANPCDNYLYVFSKNEDQLEEFKEAVKDKKNNNDLSLEKLYPRPEDANANWEDKNWGTSYAVGSKLYYSNNTQLYYFLVSPWSPPTLWVKNVAPLYPDLCFFMKYKEDGAGLFGGCVAKGENFADRIIDEVLLLDIFNSYLDIGFKISDEDFKVFDDTQ